MPSPPPPPAAAAVTSRTQRFCVICRPPVTTFETRYENSFASARSHARGVRSRIQIAGVGSGCETPGIRYATPADADALAALWLATALHAYASIFPPYSPPPELGDLAESLRRDLRHPRGRGLVIEETHGFTGMVVVRPWPGSDTTGQLARLFVTVACWGRGLGGRLHDAAVAELAALGFANAKLWVLRDNERARSFYERRGWQLTEETTTTGDTDVVEVQYRLVL